MKHKYKREIMATKKTNSKSKSNVSRASQLTQFKFRWWMALVLVAVIAIIGIVILRFSNAGTKPYFTFDTYGCPSAYGIPTVTLYPGSNSNCVRPMEKLVTGYFIGTKNSSSVKISQNGVYGNDDVATIKIFQTSKGLVADGIIGQRTWVALVDACYIKLQCTQYSN